MRSEEKIRGETEADGKGWLVIAGDHGWLHGDLRSAIIDANEIAKSFGADVTITLTGGERNDTCDEDY